MARIAPGKVGVSGLGAGRRQFAVGLYDFATDGGAVGDIILRGDQIPSGALIVDAFFHVDTVPTSGGSATIGLGVESASGIQGAAAISGAPWSTTGGKRGNFHNATNAPQKTTAARNLTATVGTAALTAGRFKFFVEYIEYAADV